MVKPGYASEFLKSALLTVVERGRDSIEGAKVSPHVKIDEKLTPTLRVTEESHRANRRVAMISLD